MPRVVPHACFAVAAWTTNSGSMGCSVSSANARNRVARTLAGYRPENIRIPTLRFEHGGSWQVAFRDLMYDETVGTVGAQGIPVSS